MRENRWEIKALPDKAQVATLAKEINVSEAIATLLLQRGIQTFEEAKYFFRPSLSDLHDPMLMKDMDKALERLLLAMKQGEKILVFGDYDVDGTTAVAMFYGFLNKYYDKLAFYIPDRYNEGYGISYLGIDYALENGFTLMVSLDCGIRSVDHIDYANERGIDFIICDHHLPGLKLPAAVAVLDPKRSDCNYPFKELSGCGVGFKLLQAYCNASQIAQEELFKELDLLAISICADIVPVTGENRILTYFGLKLINATPRPGIKAMIERGGIKGEITVTQVVFGFAPRINAAGRIDHASASVMMMLAKTYEDAEKYTKTLNERNQLRKDFDSSITEEAIKMIQEEDFLSDARSTVLFKEDWHKGVIGIVASRCIEKYYRPTIILTESAPGKAAGSARSVHGFDIHEAIEECSDLLIQFGGHMYAAGLTIETEKIPAFRAKFEEVVSRRITKEQLTPKIDIDLTMGFDKINPKFNSVLKQMAPFGPGNMQPVFMTDKIRHDGNLRILKELHLKLNVSQSGTSSFDAIAFGMADYQNSLSQNKPFSLCYQVEENTYNGNTNLQLMVKDIKA